MESKKRTKNYDEYLNATVIRFTVRQKKDLQSMARLAGVSLSEYVRRLVNAHLNEVFKGVDELNVR